MTLLACWFIFPLLLGLLALGCGYAAERAAGVRLAPALRIPLGLAVVIVIGQFAILSDRTAELAAPLAVVVAILGLAAAVLFGGRVSRPDLWPLVAAAGAFAAYAAPVVLSGEATFAGYIKLDDTSTFLALTDRALEHGRSLEGLAPSSYEATLDANLPYYPLGSLLPLGIGGAAMAHDLAWLYQPYLAFLAALLALVLYHVAGGLIPPRPLRAAAAVIAAQPAVLYGFAHWGGIKELAAAPLIALAAALTASAMDADQRVRALTPVLVTSAALVAVLSLGGAAWLLPLAAAVAIPLLRRRQVWRLALTTAAFVALLAPSLAVAGIFLQRDTIAPLHRDAELGNLIAPLSALQLFGIWPVGDFRLRPDSIEVAYVLIGVVVLAAVVGTAVAVARRSWDLPLYVAAALGGALAFGVLGSPWVAAKAYAMGAPALLIAALAACGWAYSGGRRVEAAVVALAIAGGVVWSNALAYREVNLAPRDQLLELESIGTRFAGQGPTLMTEYQPYGVRHFLRDADPEGASELRRRLVPLRDGSSLAKAAFADLDAFQLDALLAYRTIVLRRSPLASRPPAPYRLVWSRDFYEVWQRSAQSPTPVDHVPLGHGADVAAPAPCGAVRETARSARAVLAAPAPTSLVVPLGAARRPAGWRADSNDLRVVYPSSRGELVTQVSVPRSGRYRLWVGGSFRGRVRLFVDGREIGSRRHHLGWGTVFFTSVGSAELTAGPHTLRLAYELEGPGAHGTPWALGPLALSRSGLRPPVRSVPAAEASRLCGTMLDWIEGVA